MGKRFIVVAALLGTLVARLEALVIEGVAVPPTAVVSGRTLQLNGAGVRTIVLLVVPIKAYVASFYAPSPVRSWQAILASPGPLKLNFTFLQAVGQSQVTQAWQAQFQQSVTYRYPRLEADQSTFIKMFGPLKKGGVESVEIDGTLTRVYDDGKLKGTIDSPDFAKALLSLWFGSDPVMPTLKTALLGN